MSSAPTAQSMANRFRSPRKTEIADSSNARKHSGIHSINELKANTLEVNPHGNGYVTATIRRNNLPMPNKNERMRYARCMIR